MSRQCKLNKIPFYVTVVPGLYFSSLVVLVVFHRINHFLNMLVLHIQPPLPLPPLSYLGRGGYLEHFSHMLICIVLITLQPPLPLPQLWMGGRLLVLERW